VSLLIRYFMELILDAANDVYASLLIYEKLIALGKEREIEVDRRSMCSDHGEFKNIIPRPISPNGEVVHHIAGRGSLSPSPAQTRTISLFMEGKTVDAIALEMSVKRTTTQYVKSIVYQGELMIDHTWQLESDGLTRMS